MENKLFSELGLSKDIEKAIQDLGYDTPTSIQNQTIPAIMEGRDLIGNSHTGTGKTAAFVIPALSLINQADRSIQVMVLCPTRELAVQCCEEVKKLAKYQPAIKVLAVYGGDSINNQIKELKRGVQFVVGTPGRVMDHMRRKTLKTGGIKLIVLDEADEMLRMGFREDMETILSDVPDSRQTVLFSATMPREIIKISYTYLRNPIVIKIDPGVQTEPDISQFYYEIPGGQKVKAMEKLLEFHNTGRSLIFCNTKHQVDELTEELRNRGFSADCIHGDMKQANRSRIMGDFKQGRISVLVATDVAARGIDVEGIEAVYNYDVPQSEEYYVHRIGRTGRAGRKGTAHTLVSGWKQLSILKGMQRIGSKKIQSSKIPSHQAIDATRKDKQADFLRSLLKKSTEAFYMELVTKLTSEGYDPTEIAGALLQDLMNRNTESYRAKLQRQG